MKMKYTFICALSLNVALASALKADILDDIAADRVKIQNVYNIYNNSLVAENNSLMSALNNYASNASSCVSGYFNNTSKASTLEASVDSFAKELKAFDLSYKDIKADYERQVNNLERLTKLSSLDRDRLQYARNLFKNLKLLSPDDLKYANALRQSLNSIEASYASFAESFARSRVEFSLAKPQLDGIETSKASLEKFFEVAKQNLEQSQADLSSFEPKVKALYEQYQDYLAESISNYKDAEILAEDILFKSLENFNDIKENFAFTNAEDFVFARYNNLRLNKLLKPKDLLQISKAKVASLGSKSLVKAKSALDVDEAWQRPASFSASANTAGHSRQTQASSTRTVDRAIKELQLVISIIDDLNANLDTSYAVLNNVESLSSTIKLMSDNAVSLLKKSLNLSTESQVLLTNVEIFKGDFDIKSRQANISVENIKKSFEEIKVFKAKIKELL